MRQCRNGHGAGSRLPIAWLATGLVTLAIATPVGATAAKNDGQRVRAQDGGRMAAELPIDRRATVELRSELGPEFSVKHTPHFRIAYNTGIEFADFHGELFEAVYRSFRDFFEKSGFRLEPLTERLEVVLFDDREQYMGYAASHSPEAQSAGGFYSSKENRIAFFDSLSDETYRRNSKHLETVAATIRAQREQLSEIGRADEVTFRYADGRTETHSKRQALKVIAGQERELRAERRRIKAFYQDRNLTTTIHECVHQLAYNLGVQSLRVVNAKWLGEGLATYFETMGYTDLGPTGNRNPERFNAYRAARDAGRLIGLTDLLTEDEHFDVTRADAETAYAQSWALVQYLFDERAEAFLEYLRLAATPRPPDVAPSSWRVQSFERALGADVATVEKAWHAYMHRFDS